MTRSQPASIANLPITYVNEYYTPPGVEFKEIPRGCEPTFHMETLYPTTQVRAFETLFTEAVIVREEEPRRKDKSKKVEKKYVSRCSSFDSSSSFSEEKHSSTDSAADKLAVQKAKILRRACKDLSIVERDYELSRRSHRSASPKRVRSVPRRKEQSPKRSPAKTTKSRSYRSPAPAPMSVVPVVQARSISSTTSQCNGVVGTTRYYFHQFPSLATSKTNPFSPVKKRAPTMTALQSDAHYYPSGVNVNITSVSAHPDEFLRSSGYKTESKLSQPVYREMPRSTPAPVMESPRIVNSGVTSSYTMSANVPTMPMPSNYQALPVMPVDSAPMQTSYPQTSFAQSSFAQSSFMPVQSSFMPTQRSYMPTAPQILTNPTYRPVSGIVEQPREVVEYNTRGTSDAASTSSKMSSYSISLSLEPAAERKSLCC